MLILDTNVISETLRPNPSHRVLTWLDQQDPSCLFITAITAAEMLFGVEVMKGGKRQHALKSAIQHIIFHEFEERVLPFTLMAAQHYASHMVLARLDGKAVSQSDGMIAAIALSHRGYAVATRDVAPFEALGVEVVNPWNTTELPAA